MITFLAIFNSLALLALGFLLFKLNKMYQRAEKQLTAQQRFNTRMQQDLRAMCSGAVGLGQRLIEVEHLSKQLVMRVEVSDNRDVGLSNYSHAAKLIEMGASPQEVQSSCGLTAQEVDLLEILHRQGEEVL
jgi:hypothetical protein